MGFIVGLHEYMRPFRMNRYWTDPDGLGELCYETMLIPNWWWPYCVSLCFFVKHFIPTKMSVWGRPHPCSRWNVKYATGFTATQRLGNRHRGGRQRQTHRVHSRASCSNTFTSLQRLSFQCQNKVVTFRRWCQKLTFLSLEFRKRLLSLFLLKTSLEFGVVAFQIVIYSRERCGGHKLLSDLSRWKCVF